MTYSLADLMRMDRSQLHQVMLDGAPLNLSELVDTQYLGVDLSLPWIGRRLLWHTFRKTFHQDPVTGQLRGWNVRMEQTGVTGPRIPMTDKKGAPVTFGHYVLEKADHVDWPGGYRCAHFLDYGHAGNTPLDLARFGYTPLVSVNEGSSELLLGWEIFRVGPRFLPMKLYWALQKDGPLDRVVPPPRA